MARAIIGVRVVADRAMAQVLENRRARDAADEGDLNTSMVELVEEAGLLDRLVADERIVPTDGQVPESLTDDIDRLDTTWPKPRRVATKALERRRLARTRAVIRPAVPP